MAELKELFTFSRPHDPLGTDPHGAFRKLRTLLIRAHDLSGDEKVSLFLKGRDEILKRFVTLDQLPAWSAVYLEGPFSDQIPPDSHVFLGERLGIALVIQPNGALYQGKARKNSAGVYEFHHLRQLTYDTQMQAYDILYSDPITARPRLIAEILDSSAHHSTDSLYKKALAFTINVREPEGVMSNRGIRSDIFALLLDGIEKKIGRAQSKKYIRFTGKDGSTTFFCASGEDYVFLNDGSLYRTELKRLPSPEGWSHTIPEGELLEPAVTHSP